MFVLPSHNEGLSIALLEAMAHGCAVVTTPAGATLDAVSDGRSALVVPIGDARRLAAALRRMIVDPALRAALQAEARQRWCDDFEIGGHCRRLVELYGELRPDLVAESHRAAEGSVAPGPASAPPRVANADRSRPWA